MKKVQKTCLLLLALLLSMGAVAQIDRLRQEVQGVNVGAIKEYLLDMKSELGDRYGRLIKQTETLEKQLATAQIWVQEGALTADQTAAIEKMLDLKRAILLANPLLDRDKIVAVRFVLGQKARTKMAESMCTPPANHMGLMDTPHQGYDAEICELSNLRSKQITRRTLFKPKDGLGVADVQLHWDAKKMVFATPVSVQIPTGQTIYAWHIFEKEIQGDKPAKQLTKIDEPDLEYADPCYLPDGKILFTTNLGYNGIPCENGLRVIHNLAVLDPKSGQMRKVSFDQDGNWSPTVLSNGRIMYTRWEYTDLTHYFSRIVMHANPDGTETRALYGSGSYWPNSIFGMQQLPGSSGERFIGVVSGHHGVAHSGRLYIFDPSKSRKEEKGVVQEVPFRNRVVVPEIKDYLVDGVFPQFTRPFPLNDKYFLTAAKPSKDGLWGIYLVDVFDNMTLITQTEGEGYIQPIPLVERPTPPIIPERIDLKSKEATVFIQDIYQGEGLRGVPRGTVKTLRVFTYEYGYLNAPTDHDAMGIQSGWDIKRELGTVAVESDGSALFKIPANTPVSLQPLDQDGRAIQWMRSWFTAMPGEILSCVGCHEDQNTIVIPKRVLASHKSADTLKAPIGGVRPFTFDAEIQPVLDRYCVSCHDGSNGVMTFRSDTSKLYQRGVVSPRAWDFKQSYLNLHPYFYRQGAEADMYVLRPYEYHASNSELIQMLEKGHHRVELDPAAMQTLTKWVDLNMPYRGAFDVVAPYKGFSQYERRRELMSKYGNVETDWRKEIETYTKSLQAVTPIAKANKLGENRNSSVAKLVVGPSGSPQQERVIPLANGVQIKLRWIPAGRFNRVEYDPKGRRVVRPIQIDKGYWIGVTEITNEQFKAIFAEHDSRYFDQQWKDHTTPGYPANEPLQPVVRVSWQQAEEFCRALSQRIGLVVKLPSEQQWEWACRAGSEQPFWFGAAGTNYAQYENLADQQIGKLAVMGVNPKPMPANSPLREFWDFVPRDPLWDDGGLVSVRVASYQPNPWGLYDMHGNVAEWSASNAAKTDEKLVCGGSWRDRAKQATAGSRRSFKKWQAPYNVGFRVIIE